MLLPSWCCRCKIVKCKLVQPLLVYSQFCFVFFQEPTWCNWVSSVIVHLCFIQCVGVQDIFTLCCYCCVCQYHLELGIRWLVGLAWRNSVLWCYAGHQLYMRMWCMPTFFMTFSSTLPSGLGAHACCYRNGVCVWGNLPQISPPDFVCVLSRGAL